ncbi:MAG: T9SS type B sorting domain-containing protein [Lacibacter sp.]|jgi:gliding motility-associated-like protein
MKTLSLIISSLFFYCLGISQVNLTSGLVLHHPFNGNTNDVSGNAINGTANNVSLTTDRAGNANSAYYFSSINSYIELLYSNLYNFAPSGSFTISVWVLPDQGYSWPAQAVVVKSPPNPNYLASQWNYGTYLFNYKAMGGFGGNNVVNGTSTLSSTQCWYNIVQTYDNGRWNMYVNGVLESSDLSQTRFILQDAFSKIAYGRKGESDGDYYKGKIDDVRIYNRVVTADEITALFNENNPCRFTNQVCSGSLGTPIVNITFGSGSTNPGPQISTLIPGASTNYNYAAYATGNPPSVIFDGDYATVNAVPNNGAWFTGGTDHTGNPNGYMAFFNSAPTPGEFYRQTVSGLCPGTTYEFSVWVANVINPSVLPGAILPNITFKILDPSTSAILGLFNSGDIPMSNSMTWRQYSFLFQSPAATNSVTLVLENNNIGGNTQPGNDLALDDITFRPCGPGITAAINTPSICLGQTVNLTGNVTGSFNNPAFQWQLSSDGGITFSNITGASNANHTLSDLPAGNYKLQLVAAESVNINSPTCRFISNVIDLRVNALPPTPVATVNQPTCALPSGNLTISSPTGTGFEYSLNGINYQTSTSFSNLAQGTYSLTVRNNSTGCVSSPSNVTINPPPAVPSLPTISTITHPTCNISTGSFSVISPTGAGLEYSINGSTYQASTLFTGIAPGIYGLTVRNTVTGCITSPTQIPINNAPTPPSSAVVSISQPNCNFSFGSITVTSPAGSQFEYNLNGGSYQTATTFTNLAPGSYQLGVRNTTNLCVAAPVTVSINGVPQPPGTPVIGNIIQPTCLLPSGTVQISAPTGTNFEYSIDEITYQLSNLFTGVPSGNYNAIVRDRGTNCISAQSSFTINNVPSLPPAAVVTVLQRPSCTTDKGILSINSPTGPNFEYSLNGISYQPSTVFNNLDTGTYLVTVRNKTDGCTSQPVNFTLTAEAILRGRYYLPNAFTPNNDGLNDCFGIKNWGLMSEFKLMVYNRWGEEVFYTTNPNQCWNGTFKGVPAMPGNYVYYIRAVNLCGTIEQKGNLTLIR